MSFKTEIQALFDRMATAYIAGDAAGCAAIFTEDARLLSPYAGQARGRDAITELHRIWTAGGGGEKTLTVIEAGNAGDLGWALIAYSDGAGQEEHDGKTLAVLKRQPNGGWLASHCSLTSDVPPLAGQ